MTDRHAGFRFDIYERVQLPDTLPDIGQLQQIELLPHISADPSQEQVLLRGHLELQADYIPESEGGEEQTFQHRIPVEISLPVKRKLTDARMDVEMDRFDVELSSPRSLNVTGVLSISGLPAVREAASGQLNRSEEKRSPVATVSAAAPIVEPAAGQAADQPVVSPSLTSADGQLVEQADEQAAERSEDRAKKAKSSIKKTSETVNVVADQQTEPAAEQAVADLWSQTADPVQADIDYEEVIDEVQQQHEPVFAALEKEETKVAFKAKPADESDLIAEDSAEASVRSNNALEWRKLFLSGEPEARFERMRLYIAQREDTIESIALRYALSSREIALHNQLGDAGITEGQVVYIPSR